MSEQRCISGKVRYPSKGEAHEASRHQRFRADVYDCGYCDGYHLAGHRRKNRSKRRMGALDSYARGRGNAS